MQRKSIISFFIRNPDFFLKTISEHYPFKNHQLNKYREILLWDYISSNEAIIWQKDIIDSNLNRLDWKYLSENSKVFSDLSMLGKYENFIDWKGKEGVWRDSITENNGLPWNESFIESVESKIDFNKLSASRCVKWSERLIDTYIGRWNMKELACNETVPWSLHLFEKYLDTSYFQHYPVKGNVALISNINFIEKYQNYLDWDSIFANEQLPWFELDLINRWKDRIDWWGIALNELFFKSDKKFFFKHIDQWYIKQKSGVSNFNALSRNNSLLWTKEFIETFKDLWDWERLCANEGISWSFEMIDYFSEKFKWGGFEPCFLKDEEGNEISPFGGKCVTEGLVFNESIPWSIDFLSYYEKFLDFEALVLNKALWDNAFASYVDDDIVDIVLRII